MHIPFLISWVCTGLRVASENDWRPCASCALRAKAGELSRPESRQLHTRADTAGRTVFRQLPQARHTPTPSTSLRQTQNKSAVALDYSIIRGSLDRFSTSLARGARSISACCPRQLDPSQLHASSDKPQHLLHPVQATSMGLLSNRAPSNAIDEVSSAPR